MENSTKIIIGSSIVVVGAAAVYLVMSRKKKSGAATTASGDSPIISKAVDNRQVNSKTDAPITAANASPSSAGIGPSSQLSAISNKSDVLIQAAYASPADAGIAGITVPAAGKLLKTYCDGIKSMGEYTDGLGGTVVKVIDAKAQACGYVPPSTDFSDTNDYPEVTAILINELHRIPGLQATLKKWREEELKFRNPNFDSTAPHHGNKSLYQYTIQEMFRHGYSNRRCSVNRDMNDFLIDKRGSNNNGTDFNDWGRGVVNNKDHFNCDYKTEKLTLAFINARDVAKANSAGVYARKLASDLITAYNEMFTM